MTPHNSTSPRSESSTNAFLHDALCPTDPVQHPLIVDPYLRCGHGIHIPSPRPTFHHPLVSTTTTSLIIQQLGAQSTTFDRNNPSGTAFRSKSNLRPESSLCDQHYPSGNDAKFDKLRSNSKLCSNSKLQSDSKICSTQNNPNTIDRIIDTLRSTSIFLFPLAGLATPHAPSTRAPRAKSSANDNSIDTRTEHELLNHDHEASHLQRLSVSKRFKPRPFPFHFLTVFSR